MKITEEHYQHMKQEIAKIDRTRALQHLEGLKLDQRVKDISKRFRWDMSYAAKLTPWICNNLYSYMDDTHIDTALRNIMKDLEY